MKLRYKILSGFAILAIMLFVAGVWSIFQVKYFGESLEEIIGSRYEKIGFAKSINELLERNDRQALLSFLENSGDFNFEDFGKDFLSVLTEIEKYKITDEEKTLLNQITAKYKEYVKIWNIDNVSLGTTSEKLKWYKENVKPLFDNVQDKINKLIEINQAKLISTAQEIKDRTRRAIIPGVVAIIAAIVFTLLFNYFVNQYMIKPIITLKKQVDDFISKGIPLTFRPITDDEIARLTESIYLLTSHVDKDIQEQ